MNNTFDFSRFMMVLRKDFRSLWPRYGVGMTILASATLAVWLFVLLISQWTSDGLDEISVPIFVRWCVVIFCTFLSVLIAPFRLYGECNKGKEGIYFAMLPASKLEKYLSMIIHCVVVVPLLVLGGSMVVDSLLWMLPFGNYSDSLFFNLSHHPLWSELDYMDKESLQMLYFVTNPLLWIIYYLGSVMVFLFANTIFKRNKFLLTILALWGLGFVEQIIVTPIFIVAGLNDWFEGLGRWLDGHSFEQALRILGWVTYGWGILQVGVLTWWTGFRLKRMRY